MNRLALLALLVPTFASAVPLQVQHQGRLLDSTGAPVDGDVEIAFSLYHALDASGPLWTEVKTLQADNGFFHAVLGDDAANPLDSETLDGDALYLGIRVEGQPEMPRTAIGSVPFALNADRASFADTAAEADRATTADTATRADEAGKADKAAYAVEAGTAEKATEAEKAAFAADAGTAQDAKRAETAKNVDGGKVSAAEISVGGRTVVNTDGVVVGPLAGPSLADLSCKAGEYAAYDGGWTCRAPTWADLDDAPPDVLTLLADACSPGQAVTWTDDGVSCVDDLVRTDADVLDVVASNAVKLGEVRGGHATFTGTVTADLLQQDQVYSFLGRWPGDGNYTPDPGKPHVPGELVENHGKMFDPETGRFEIPVNGLYALSASYSVLKNDTTTDYAHVIVQCDRAGDISLGRLTPTGEYQNLGGTVYRVLEAGDTCFYKALDTSGYTIRSHNWSTLSAALIQATP